MLNLGKVLRLLLGAWIFGALGEEVVRGQIELGPLFHDFNLTLATGQRREIGGPLFFWETKEQTRTWGVPPLLSYTLNTDTDFSEADVLYPLISYDRFGEQYRFHLFQVISWAGGPNQTDTNTHRFTIYPLYFQQRSEDPAKNYTAVFPIYGKTQNRFFRSEADFVMWPIYVKTKKRTSGGNPGDARADFTTWNYFFPLFHHREGPGLTGWQFWPFVGKEHKEVTLATNHWGDVTTVGGHDKFFALLYFAHDTGLATENPTLARLLLPLFSYTDSPQRRSFTAPWPIGYTYTDNRSKKFREWGAPWPFIVFARGEGKTTSRVFPIFSQSSNGTVENDWYLWPAYKFKALHSPPLERTRHRVFFFLYSDTTERNTESGAYQRRRDFFPFYTTRREFDGSERLQVLAILESFLENNKSIERNWSPLWSIWRAEKDAKTAATSQSLLWNLYRRETTPQVRKCSLLFGLFQYQCTTDGKRWRLFYIPFGKARQPGRPAPH